ncbi:histidinol-phosphatase HisJ [Planococcus sp. ISL-109]|uniref:histidinol-phosphatase HisJ n=1 Tax=Planococcus sp. ISL-109 TaxID=2819166 RepID=UPI001BE6474B|nr:histidinol-phosphatase HisJ [Planococcus sp. ISL-109]
MKRDGHTHTPFCPHGTSDPFRAYILKAIDNGFQEISFTEHAPLPFGFLDPTPEQDSGMKMAELPDYFAALEQAKDEFSGNLRIRAGLEVDFIQGFEQQTAHLLEQVGPQLDDAILSVHFLRYQDRWVCADFSAEVFMQLARDMGSVQAVYDLYYDTLEASIRADLGPFKPKRIGHVTLIHKFQHSHGETIDDDDRIRKILRMVKEQGYELDVNSAGLSKPDCLEFYPPEPYIDYARNLGIPLVFGSDAHKVADLHKYADQFYTE